MMKMKYAPIITNNQRGNKHYYMKLIKYIVSRVGLISLSSTLISLACAAQTKDTSGIISLKEVLVVGYKAMNGVGHFNDGGTLRETWICEPYTR